MLGPGLQGQKWESEGRLDKAFLLGFVGMKEPVGFQTESKIVRFDHNCFSGEHTKNRDPAQDGRSMLQQQSNICVQCAFLLLNMYSFFFKFLKIQVSFFCYAFVSNRFVDWKDMPGDNDQYCIMRDLSLISPFYKCLNCSWIFSSVSRVIAWHTQDHGSSLLHQLNWVRWCTCLILVLGRRIHLGSSSATYGGQGQPDVHETVLQQKEHSRI